MSLNEAVVDHCRFLFCGGLAVGLSVPACCRHAASAIFQKVHAAKSFSAQLFGSSPLLISACTRPFTMKVGETWIPFWRA